MIQEFNIFKEYEIPEISICKPNRKKIGDLGIITEFKVNLKFNSISEINISVPKFSDGESVPYYSDLKQKNKLHIKNLGWFIIGDVSESGDGIEVHKEIPALSEESFFNYKNVSLVEGTYKFYDTVDNSNTIVGKIMGYIPSWRLGNVSSSLWNKYRTFDVTTATLYSFIMKNISEAYECFFIFDTENRIVNILDQTDVITNTDIVLSFDNLIKNVTITEKSEEYVTALAVTGGGELDIRSVNPVGGIFIYDYSYPISTGMMSEELANSVLAWQEKIDRLQPNYANYLSEYKTLNSQHITLQSQLSDLNSQKTSIENLMQVRIDAGVSDLSDLRTRLNKVESNIANKQAEINLNREESSSLYSNISTIVSELDIKNNFSDELYEELSEYTIESAYQNENIIKTSIMTDVDVQEQAQELYNQGKSVLSKISKPRFEFSIDSANFLFLKEYENFTGQFNLGSVISIYLDDNTKFRPVLLEYSFDYLNPTDFSITFGNRMRLDDSLYEFSDLIQNAISAGNSVNVNSSLWNNWTKNYESDVSSFISGALNASKNAIINSENQDITIDSVGLRGKKRLPNGEYDPKQIWMTNSTIALTKDNWNTVSTAVGNISLPDGSTAYGVAGGVLVGNIVASEELKIENENNKFYVDGNGVRLIDADLSMESQSTNSRVFISPSEGFKLQTLVGANWTDKIYLDSSGNATFSGKIISTSGTIGGYNITNNSIYTTASDSSGSIIKLNSDGTCRIGSLKITNKNGNYIADFSGKITATSGTIGGWSISENGLRSNYGDYILSNGTGKLGLLSYNGNTARFSGYVQANNISVGGGYGYIGGDQIGTGAVRGGRGGNIGGSTISPYNLDTIYATKGQFDSLVADFSNTISAFSSRFYTNDLQVANSLYFKAYEIKLKSAYINGQNIYYLGW